MPVIERPFYRDPWVGGHAEAAAAIWDWHLALRHHVLTTGAADQEGYDLEAERVRTEMTTSLLATEVVAQARKAVENFGLDSDLFAEQIRAAPTLVGECRFRDHAELRLFVDSWAAPVGRLLAALAGAGHVWQFPSADALSRGFFLLGRLLELPDDVSRGRFFLPESEMVIFGVGEMDLRAGPPSEPVRKMLWKQCVRIRDAFAQALPLMRELPRKYASGFKKYWLGGLEMVNAIERRSYDVWTGPVKLSRFHRLQVRYQARFGRMSFRAK